MSLVNAAYGSDSDSDGDTEDDINIYGSSKKKLHPTGVDLIEDLDEDYVGADSVAFPAKENISNAFSLRSDSSTICIETSSHSFDSSTLPLPKPLHQLQSQRNDEGCLEEMVKPKSYSDQVVIEKPKGKISKDRPVQIVLPSLDVPTNNSQENALKRPSSSGKEAYRSKLTSRLLAKLPEPKHVSIKTINRQLVPHSVHKKQPLPQVARPSNTSTQSTCSKPDWTPGFEDVTSDDSECDDSSGDFFSFPDMLGKPDGALSRAEVVGKPLSFDKSSMLKRGASPSFISSAVSSDDLRPSKRALIDDADLSSTERQDQDVFVGPTNDESVGPNGAASINSMAMLRLDGRRRRGRDEPIDFIEIKQSDQVTGAVQLKGLSEEQNISAASLKKDEPDHMAKRKHQITHLGHMAKLRELDLKNQWADGRLSRQQAGAKYGFS